MNTKLNTSHIASQNHSTIEVLESRIAPASIIVTTELDVVDGTDDLISLREAIAAANSNTASADAGAVAGTADGDIITFDATIDGTPIVLSLGQLTITDDVTIDAEAQDIQIDADTTSRIFQIDTATGVGTNKAVSLLGLTLLNGDATAGAVGVQNGGAILITGAENVTLTDVNIESSLASNLGGGISVTDSTLTMTGGGVSSSTAYTAGGGIDAAGASTVTLTDVILSGNFAGIAGVGLATPGNGGGMHNGGTSAVTIRGGSIDSNTAFQEGGGLWNSAAGTMTIEYSFDSFTETSISGNTADGNGTEDGGGGIFNLGGEVFIADAFISSNFSSATTAGNGGGGIFNKGAMTLVDVFIDSNSTDTGADGGGILNSTGGVLDVFGGVIDLNVAGRAGGGIENNGATVTITDTSFGGNSAEVNGGGIHTTGAGTVDITDAIFEFDSSGNFIGNSALNEGGVLWNSATGTLNVTDTSIALGTALLGGGVFNNGGTVSITGGDISSNISSATTAGAGGGGIFNKGPMTLTDVSLDSNSTDTGADGGGILNSTGATLTIAGGYIDNNSAGRAGGGIENNAGTVTISDASLGGNFAEVNGGGIHTSGAGTVNLTRVTMSFDNGFNASNSAGNEGGALWNSLTGTLNVTDSTISQNVADFGGGIHNDGGTMTVTGSTIDSNEALTSGGGFSLEGGTTAARVINSTIANNFADGENGGGIVVLSAPTGTGTIGIFNSTIAGNSAAGFGGGLYVGAGTVSLASTLLGDNFDAVTDNDVDRAAAGATINADHSLIEAAPAGTINGTNTNNIYNTDPQLSLNGLDDNGGPTPTIALEDTSPALDKGSNPLNLTTDQRGFGYLRTVGIDTDIGAFEKQDVALIVKFAVSSGKTDNVLVYDAAGTKLATIATFGGNKAIKAGVTVATGDVDGDRIEDIIVGAGKSALGPVVKVFSGRTGLEVKSFLAFDPAFKGGVNVAVGNITDTTDGGPTDGRPFPDPNGPDRLVDNIAEIVVGAGIGKLNGAPVGIFTNQGVEIANLDPYPAAKTNPGIRVAVGDVNGDGYGDIVTAPAKSTFGALVKVFSGQNGQQLDSFLAYTDKATKGLFVATGDLNGDGRAEIITGNDAGGVSTIKAFRLGTFFGQARVEVANFTAFGAAFKGGVRVASVDIDGDGKDEILAGTGKAAIPQALIFNGQAPHAQRFAVPAGDFTGKDFASGVYVG